MGAGSAGTFSKRKWTRLWSHADAGARPCERMTLEMPEF